MFARLFKKDSMKAPARALYVSLVREARKPSLYGPDGAPDTVDGRFDLITLHAVLVFRRLRSQGEAGRHMSQLVFDIMFDDMDAALREMGTGDLSVGKKIREMGEAFYGRAKAYEAALDAGDEGALAEVIERNLFAAEDEAAEDAPVEAGPAARRLAAYAAASERALADQPAEDLLDGAAPRFPAAA